MNTASMNRLPMATRRLALQSRTYAHSAASRSATRRQLALPKQQHHQRRHYADAAGAAQGGSSHALVGGLVGGGAVLAVGYGWYHFSGAKSFVNSMHSVKSRFDAATKSVQDSAPAPNEALQWLRSTSLSYAAFIPGAKYYVGKAFDDLDAIHSKHSGEVDEIVQEAYTDLKALTKKGGLSLDTAGEAMSILGETMNKIMALAGDAAEDLLKNHPELKSQLGGGVSQLKSMGDSLGPEAKKQVQETWEQVRGVLAGGVGASTIPQIKKLVDDKVQQLRQLGDKAWDKGMEQAKPYLDKVPQAKELIEKNKDALKSGDVATLVQKLKQAAESGNADELSKYVDAAKDKAEEAGKHAGGGLEKYLSFLPGGSDVVGRIQKLAEVGQKHGKEAEKLVNDALAEISEVLQKKTKEAEELAQKASKD